MRRPWLALTGCLASNPWPSSLLQSMRSTAPHMTSNADSICNEITRAKSSGAVPRQPGKLGGCRFDRLMGQLKRDCCCSQLATPRIRHLFGLVLEGMTCTRALHGCQWHRAPRRPAGRLSRLYLDRMPRSLGDQLPRWRPRGRPHKESSDPSRRRTLRRCRLCNLPPLHHWTSLPDRPSTATLH